jgi:hypothetical protein
MVFIGLYRHRRVLRQTSNGAKNANTVGCFFGKPAQTVNLSDESHEAVSLMPTQVPNASESARRVKKRNESGNCGREFACSL